MKKSGLVAEIIRRVLAAYNEDGTLAHENYYENIILEELTAKEYAILRKLAEGGAA
jgi:hypothetical protein